MTRTLGRSGIHVSGIGLGCWAIGGPFFSGDTAWAFDVAATGATVGALVAVNSVGRSGNSGNSNTTFCSRQAPSLAASSGNWRARVGCGWKRKPGRYTLNSRAAGRCTGSVPKRGKW